jgi:hypothetical protein
MFLMTTSVATAGAVKTTAIPNKGFFGIQINGTPQEFYGRVDHVISVSFQEYTTGPLIVSEVVVDMAESNQLLRIYSARPPSLDDATARANAAVAGATTALPAGSGTLMPAMPTAPAQIADADKRFQDAAGKAAAGLVVKTYPVTTHAKTVEFTVSTKEELLTFYSSFRDLLVGREIKTKSDGSTLAVNNTLAASQNAGNLVSVNRIGGTLFIID